jgi:hypothetical protein
METEVAFRIGQEAGGDVLPQPLKRIRPRAPVMRSPTFFIRAARRFLARAGAAALMASSGSFSPAHRLTSNGKAGAVASEPGDVVEATACWKTRLL